MVVSFVQRLVHDKKYPRLDPGFPFDHLIVEVEVDFTIEESLCRNAFTLVSIQLIGKGS